MDFAAYLLLRENRDRFIRGMVLLMRGGAALNSDGVVTSGTLDGNAPLAVVVVVVSPLLTHRVVYIFIIIVITTLLTESFLNFRFLFIVIVI